MGWTDAVSGYLQLKLTIGVERVGARAQVIGRLLSPPLRLKRVRIKSEASLVVR